LGFWNVPTVWYFFVLHYINSFFKMGKINKDNIRLRNWQRSVFVSFVINHISLHNNTLFLQAPVFNREKHIFSEKFIHQINISNDDIIYDVYTCLISNSKEQHEDNLQRNCYTLSTRYTFSYTELLVLTLLREWGSVTFSDFL
jgi:hypothetical protein